MHHFEEHRAANSGDCVKCNENICRAEAACFLGERAPPDVWLHFHQRRATALDKQLTTYDTRSMLFRSFSRNICACPSQKRQPRLRTRRLLHPVAFTVFRRFSESLSNCSLEYIPWLTAMLTLVA